MSLYIPQRNLLWLGNAGYSKFFLLNNKIVAWNLLAGPTLFVSMATASIPQSPDMESVVKGELGRRYTRLLANDLRYDYRIPLTLIFGRFAFAIPGDATPAPPPKVTGFSFDNGHPVIAFEGQNGAKAAVTLDRNVHVIAATLRGQPIPLAGPLKPEKITPDEE